MTMKEVMEAKAEALKNVPVGKLYAITSKLSRQENEALTAAIIELNNHRLWEGKR